jgi:alpha-ketoglutarate-dependent taurine dioxygenase
MFNITNSDIKFIKKNYLDQNQYHVIIQGLGKSQKIIKKNVNYFTKIFGKLVKQDKHGKLIAEIKPSLKKIKLKQLKKREINLRYHQTNTGGDVHSDGPQLENPPKYVMMACVNNAEKGGYSILSSIEKIIFYLKKYDRKTLLALKKDFYFEKRGFYFKEQSKVFKKPVIKYHNKDLRFRYLRDYMQQAYKIKSLELNKTQTKALDKLDKLLADKKYQYKYKLQAGDILLLNNFKMAHGRSRFNLKEKNNRTLIRAWFR